MFGVPFVYLFYPFPPEPPEARKRDLLKMTPIPRLSPGPSVDGCVTVCVLFGDKLAFFLFFKQPLIILSASPLEQSAFDSMASGCLYPRWQRETERTAQPILEISASGWGGAAACGWPRLLLTLAFRRNSTCTPCLLPGWLADGW